MASGCSAGGGKSQALERSAVCQWTERSPKRYFIADAAIGVTNRKNRIINVFLTVWAPCDRTASYKRHRQLYINSIGTFAIGRAPAMEALVFRAIPAIHRNAGRIKGLS
jgi:hypothetical protein